MFSTIVSAYRIFAQYKNAFACQLNSISWVNLVEKQYGFR